MNRSTIESSTLASAAIAAVAVGASLWSIYKISRIGSREGYLPPGPPTVPLLGNLSIFPKENAHFQFTEWAKQYGDIFSLKLGPGTIIVITSHDAFHELMDQNSSTTADRPQLYVPNTAVPVEKHMVMMPYGEGWRKLRRICHELLTPKACLDHLPIQQAETTQLMYELLTNPSDYRHAISRNMGSSILSVLFGKRAPQYSTPEVTKFFHVQEMFVQIVEPAGTPPVDLVPFLKYVPERWAPWKTLCKKVRRLQRELYFGLLEHVENRIAKGEANGCWIEELIARAEELDIDREQVAYVGGVLIEAGADTTFTFLLSFVLCMVAYPEIQKRAQAEIDQVVGSDRTPTADDLENLPYLRAIIKEVHRFRPVTPLVVPRSTTADIMYKGYRIPAGATIFSNNWGMSHDPKYFENEHEFNPDRYLNNRFGVRPEFVHQTKFWKEDPSFGSGRRSCPGIHFAKNAINTITVNMLWSFNFGKAKDPITGLEIEADVWDYARGIVSCPNPYKCTITPRSTQHAEHIKRQYQEATPMFERYELELSAEDRKFVNEQRSQF